MEQKQADAVAQVMSEFGRDGLVTKDYLDARLAQLALTHAATTFALFGLFKVFS